VNRRERLLRGRLERELTHRAAYDSLTGLANRTRFIGEVEQAVARAQRDGAFVGVLAIDLDDFKIINEMVGHARGDRLLVAFAQRLSGLLRREDTAARLSGDEFAVLVEAIGNPADIHEVAGRIVDSLTEPFRVAGQAVTISASLGVATTGEATTAEELIRQADLAQLLAKSEGKRQWRHYQANAHAALTERLELRGALEEALANDQFTLHYQPIVDVATGGTAGMEALVRWQHPTRGMVPPGQFIEVAEATGLIVPLGTWVLRDALATAARWRREGAPIGYVSVNVSARQFRTAGFVDTVLAALEQAAVGPDVLMLEITESLLLRDDDRIWEDLNRLRRLGVRIAIDDFGTGYSSLSYLRLFPVDALKIDKSFTDHIVGSDQQRAVVDAMLRLATALRLRVIAEGIETAEQRDMLAGMGCPYGQGYLFSRPLPMTDAEQWLLRDAQRYRPAAGAGSTVAI
jgi:diguanylate cyclase (GGDEF)-like protein